MRGRITAILSLILPYAVGSVYRNSERRRKNRLPCESERILVEDIIRGGFLTDEERKDLTDLARDGTVEHRLARRANALVLLDRGMSCEEVGRVLLIDDDTIRTWHRLFLEDGVDGLAGFHYGGRSCQLTAEQQDKLKAWVGETLPQTTREVGAWIEQAFDVVYESRSGLVALLHRLGLEHRKPQAVSRKLDPGKQQAFIDAYEALLRMLPDDEAVLGDAVHPAHAARPAGCWAPKEGTVAVDQTSGRERLNIHGAIDLETGRTCMLDVVTRSMPRAPSRCWRPSKPCIRRCGSSMCSWTTPAITTPSWFRTGSPNLGVGFGCISCRRTARI